MEFTEKDLDNLGKLARIAIAPEEKKKMLQDMKAILGYVSEINSISGDMKPAKSDVRNVLREDIITNETGSKTEAILREAPHTKGDYVEVAQVFK